MQLLDISSSRSRRFTRFSSRAISFCSGLSFAFGPGEGGSVDVPASFHLSTADELRFSDGSVFTAAIQTTIVVEYASEVLYYSHLTIFIRGKVATYK